MVKVITDELVTHVLEGGFIDCKDIHDGSCL